MKMLSNKREFPHVKNIIKHSSWVPRVCEELRTRHVRPYTKSKDPTVPKGGESVIRLRLDR